MATLHKFDIEKPEGYVWFGERQEVAGTHYRQPEFRKAISRSGEVHFLLEREPGNRYDPNAIKFIIDNNGRLYHIGYIDAETAVEIAAEINSGASFDWFKVLPIKIDEYRSELHLTYSLFWPNKKNRGERRDPMSEQLAQNPPKPIGKSMVQSAEQSARGIGEISATQWKLVKIKEKWMSFKNWFNSTKVI